MWGKSPRLIKSTPFEIMYVLVVLKTMNGFYMWYMANNVNTQGTVLVILYGISTGLLFSGLKLNRLDKGIQNFDLIFHRSMHWIKSGIKITSLAVAIEFLLHLWVKEIFSIQFSSTVVLMMLIPISYKDINKFQEKEALRKYNSFFQSNQNQ